MRKRGKPFFEITIIVSLMAIFLNLTLSFDGCDILGRLPQIIGDSIIVGITWFFLAILVIVTEVWKLPLFILSELKVILEPFNPEDYKLKREKKQKRKRTHNIIDETSRDNETSEIKGYESSAIMDEEDEE